MTAALAPQLVTYLVINRALVDKAIAQAVAALNLSTVRAFSIWERRRAA